MTDDPLRGKLALVTGAGSGLGAATARAFAGAGACVACVDLRGEAAERTSGDLAASGAESIALACDVSDADAVFRTVEAVVARFGRLDVAINCAAVDYVVSVEAMTRRLETLGCIAQGTWSRLSGEGLQGRRAQARLGTSAHDGVRQRLPERYRRLAVQALPHSRGHGADVIVRAADAQCPGVQIDDAVGHRQHPRIAVPLIA